MTTSDRYVVVKRGKGVWYVLDTKTNSLGACTLYTKREATAIAESKNNR